MVEYPNVLCPACKASLNPGKFDFMQANYPSMTEIQWGNTTECPECHAKINVVESFIINEVSVSCVVNNKKQECTYRAEE